MSSRLQTTAQVAAWLKASGGATKMLHAATPRVRPVPGSQSLAPMLKLIQDLAAAHGWAGEDHLTYNEAGEDEGLHVTLVREVILFAEVQAVKGVRSLRQQHWLDMLRATGQCEVYEWTPDEMPAIKERLSRPRVCKEVLRA